MGISIKAVHSYEQGWRKIPHHVERQLLFLLFKTINIDAVSFAPCWDVLSCPDTKQKKCPAREFDAGDLCWFINGTKCNGKAHKSWSDKMEECRTCKVFQQFFQTVKGIKING